MSLFHPASNALIQNLTAQIRAEFDAQRRHFMERCALPVSERVEKGDCLDGLVFEQIDSQGMARFRHAGNHSRLREGDRVRLNRGTVEEGHQGMIFHDGTDEVWIASAGHFKPSAFAGESAGWMLDEDWIDLESHYLQALEQLAQTEIGQEILLPLLLGELTDEMDAEEYQAAYDDLELDANSWEDFQKQAFAGCLSASHCYLVQGPPGTGKTKVLGRVVAELVRRGQRVLVTGPTHLAIDNALEAAAREIGDDEKVARFAEVTRGRSRAFETYADFSSSPLEGQSAWVAGATPFALKKRLPGVEFDTVVIDEASQVITPLALMAMLTGRRYLLFGDQQQLGPVLISQSRRDAHHFGIFWTLKSQQANGTMLDVTYRMNESLTHWPSENFYEGNLKPAPQVAQRRLQCVANTAPTPWLRTVLEPENSRLWIDFPPLRSRSRNEAEVALAAELLQALTRAGVKQEDIAVVTPYRRQARLIRNRIQQLEPESNWRSCLIDTVERLQGQEREVIIISWCAAQPEFIQWQFDFLLDPRRLNVAATRARTKLIILANHNLSHFHPLDPDAQEDMSLLQSLKDCALQLPAPALP